MFPTLDPNATPVEALAYALFLSLIAPTDEKSEFMVARAESIAGGMTEDEVSAAKRGALRLRKWFHRLAGL